MSLLGMPV